MAQVGYSRKYRAIHMWVEYHKGKPSVCEQCGYTSENKRQFHWANLSHEYKRELDDWKRLCVKCHSILDGHHQMLFREYCVKGHRLVLTNLYRRTRGTIECKACRHEEGVAWRAKQRSTT